MVSVITSTIREEFMENVFTNYASQRWKEKELIIVLNKNSMNLDKWKEKAKDFPYVSIYQLDENVPLGDCLNFAVEKSRYGYIAKFDDDDYYAPLYLTHAMEEFQRSEVSVVGKASYFMYISSARALLLVENTEKGFTDWLAGPTLVIKKEVFEKVRFRKRTYGEDYFFLEDCKNMGIPLYSSDRFNFTLVRRNPDQHTWKADNEALLNWGPLVANTEDFKPLVITHHD